MRTKAEIEDQIYKTMDKANQCPGMTYAEGVRDALEWVVEDTDDPPMEG